MEFGSVDKWVAQMVSGLVYMLGEKSVVLLVDWTVERVWKKVVDSDFLLADKMGIKSVA